MATIKYTCDTCERDIEVIERPTGLTTFSKCIITKGCRGKLYKTQRNRYNVRGYLEEPSDAGIFNFFPRRGMFRYSQEIPSKTWKVVHDMGIAPSVVVYEEGFDNPPVLLNENQYQMEIVNDSTLKLHFPSPKTGIVHCVARSTKDIQPTPIDLSESMFKVSNSGVLTFGVLGKITGDVTGSKPIFLCDPDNPTEIRINISIQEPDREEIFCTETISTHADNNSPWRDWDALLSRRRRNYCIKSVNLGDFISIQEFYDSLSDIPNGTRLTIHSIDYGDGFIEQNIRSRNLLLLLADSPYNTVDKRTDILIDVGEVSAARNENYFTFIDGELHVSNEKLESIYPRLVRDDAIKEVELNPLQLFMNSPFVTECVPKPPATSCQAEYVVNTYDYQIVGGSGNYDITWSLPGQIAIDDASSEYPTFTATLSSGTYTFLGNLFIVDLETGKTASASFKCQINIGS